MDVEVAPTGERARSRLDIKSALEHLKQFKEVANTKAKPKLREWKRMIYASPDPAFPSECLLSGRQIAVELLDHVQGARRELVKQLGDRLPLWASPLDAVDQQIQNWIGYIDAPCADMARLVIDGQEFLLDCADWLTTLGARLVEESEDTRSKPDAPEPAPSPKKSSPKKGKGGRPRLTANDEQLEVAFEVERYFLSEPNCTWEEACEVIRRFRGLKTLKVSTVKSRLRRARESQRTGLRVA